MTRALPPLPDPFPPAFRTMLEQILQRSGRIVGARREQARSRHRSLVQTGTFVGHRPYVAGDDLRRLDWNAFARTGHLFQKVLSEDERRAVTLWVDASPSMLAGAVPRLVTALRLAAIVGGLALVHLDGVQVQAEQGAWFVGRRAVPLLLEHLASLRPRSIAVEDGAAALVQQRAPGRVHWISDFAEPAAAERALRRLHRHGFRVTGWLPTLPSDTAVVERGWTMVLDPETGSELRVRIDAELAAALAHELHLLQRQQDRVFATGGAVLQRITVPVDDFTAARWLEAGWSCRS